MFAAFSRAQIIIFRIDALVQDFMTCMRRACAFLDVPPAALDALPPDKRRLPAENYHDAAVAANDTGRRRTGGDDEDARRHPPAR